MVVITAIWAMAVVVWVAVALFPSEREIGSVVMKFVVITTLPRMSAACGVVQVELVLPWWPIPVTHRLWTAVPIMAWGQTPWLVLQDPGPSPRLAALSGLPAITASTSEDRLVHMLCHLASAEVLLLTLP